MPPRNLHQSEPQAHARLAFHPDPPVWRQDRLSAALSPEPGLSLRVRALLATGVLALSAGLTSTSVAYEPDQEREGIVQSGPGSADLSSPGVDDPGDDDVGAPEDTTLTDILDSDPPADGVAGDPDADSGPLEADPPEDSTDSDPSAAPTEPAPAPVQQDASSPATPALPQHPPLAPRHTQLIARGATLQGRMPPEPKPQSETQARVREQAPAPAAPTAAPTAPAPVASATTPSARLNRRTCTVQPGDSLWSIATRLLAPNAASATIAHEVQRLWALNEERIGTGDPDLLVAGTILRLR